VTFEKSPLLWPLFLALSGRTDVRSYYRVWKIGNTFGIPNRKFRHCSRHGFMVPLIFFAY
jgi:hypothetical protein